MSNNPPPSTNKPIPSTGTGAQKKPVYVSSSGQTLTSLPLTARLNRFADSLYNFVGLYFVSLVSLDPYTAAQNSRFNTRGGAAGRNAAAAGAPRAGGGLGFGSSRLGGGGGLGGGPRGGGAPGGGSGAGSGRRMGTVDDVRGPECGSCG